MWHEFQAIIIKTKEEKKQKSKQNMAVTSDNLAQLLLLAGSLCPIGNQLCQYALILSLKTVNRVSYVSKINRKDFITEKLNSEEVKVSTRLKLNLPLGLLVNLPLTVAA